MSKTEDTVKEILLPFRKRIDALDNEIVSLLVDRFKIVEEVAGIKRKYDIKLVQSKRVIEVCEKNAKMAEEQGLDGKFIYDLYMSMIDYAHVLEAELMNKDKK